MEWEIGRRTGDKWEVLGTVYATSPHTAPESWLAANGGETGIQYGVKDPHDERWHLFGMTADGGVQEGEV